MSTSPRAVAISRSNLSVIHLIFLTLGPERGGTEPGPIRKMHGHEYRVRDIPEYKL